MGRWRATALLAASVLAAPAAAQEQATYRYDTYGRLQAVGRSVTGGPSSYTEYANDAADNRLARVINVLPVRAVANELRPGEVLAPLDRLTSLDGRFTMVFQEDGNFVLYFGASPLWASGTGNGRGLFLGMQGDGNLVMYAVGTVPIWASNTGGHPGAKLVLQNDGNAIIFDGATPVWSTNTCCH